MTGETQKEKHAEMSKLLQDLPEDAFAKTLSMLDSKDLVSVCRVSAFARRCAERNSIAQKALQLEGLPGQSIHDLVQHWSKWEAYQKKLKQRLFELIPGTSPDDMDTKEGKEACRKFLRSAIHEYTLRVAGSHSWYKHLPIGMLEKFWFRLDLTANMHRSYVGGNRKFYMKEEGDGTRFHYTWLPTDVYRQRYGFFDFGFGELLPLDVIVHDTDANKYHVPKSMRSPEVDVTAAVHSISISHNLYRNVLQEAINQGAPNAVLSELQHNMFSHAQSRFANRGSLRLPSLAAHELSEIVTLVGSGKMTIEQASNLTAKVLTTQQCRERRAIALSLHELCLRNFGEELTPSEKEAVSFLPLETGCSL